MGVGQHSRTREDVRRHQEACADEHPGEGRLIRAAVDDIAGTQVLSRLAREIGMTREGRCQASSENGNPAFATVMRITVALGMQVRIVVQRRLR